MIVDTSYGMEKYGDIAFILPTELKNDIFEAIPEDVRTEYKPKGFIRRFNRSYAWKFTYYFLNTPRVNKFVHFYGSKLPLSSIYNILMDMNGSDFIQDYLDNVMPYHTWLMQEIHTMLKEAENEILYYIWGLADRLKTGKGMHYTKSGKLDKRYASTRELDKLGERLNSKMKKAGSSVAMKIRQDAIRSLATGIMPLNYVTKEKTFIRREAAGLDSVHTFYASGQVIKGLYIKATLKRIA